MCTVEKGCWNDDQNVGTLVEVLKEERLESAKRSAALKCEGVGHPWSQDALQRDENKAHFYTGLTSYCTLIVIFNFLLNNCNNRSFSFEGFMATLMKVQLNLRDQDLDTGLGYTNHHFA